MGFWNQLKKTLLTSLGLPVKPAGKTPRLKRKRPSPRPPKIKKTPKKQIGKLKKKPVRISRRVKRKKPASRKGMLKPVKKMVLRKIKISKPAKKQSRKPVQVKEKPMVKQAGEFVGTVTHYFPNVQAGVIRIEETELREGDKIHITGETTNFKQQAKSMQINRIPIEHARLGEEIGLKVKDRVREGDKVYKI